MRSFYRTLRILSVITLFFFCWTFLPLWQAVAYAAEKQKPGVSSRKPGAPQKAEPRTQTAGEKFEKTLEGIREHINKVEEKSRKGQEPADEINAIKTKKAELETIDSELKTEFSATEKKLKDAKLPGEILDRHHKFVKHYQDNLKELIANLTGIERAGTKAEIDATVKKAKVHLEKTKPPRKHKPLDPNKLPNRIVKAKAKAPRLKKEDFEKDFLPQKKKAGKLASYVSHEFSRIDTNGLKHQASEFKPILVATNGPLTGLLSSDSKPETIAWPSSAPSEPALESFNRGVNDFDVIPNSAFAIPNLVVAQATVTPPTADDLSETPEVQFTQPIRDLATQLNNSPVKIYEWVRNNIEFVPTYGSIQGADMCLQTMQCNAYDTNSLLISLLRVSNLPARFVYGTIEIPIDKVMNWTGGFSDPRAAVNFIASGGIPVNPYASGGVITKIHMEHVWVETYIPYGNYRGAIMDNSIKTWIPMDGSFKQYTYTNGFDITATVPFSQDAYLSQVQTQNAVHYYQSQIQSYLDANMPDTSIVDVKGHRTITQEKYHFLPSTLPYITVAKLGTFSSVPANMAATATFTLSSPATGSDVSYTVTTAELAGKRLTVSYVPAALADEALIAKYGGFLYDVPAYMLNLKPVLKVEGVIQLTGEVTTLGSEQNLTLQFTQPSGINEAINKQLIAGAYYAVAMDLQGINENVLGKRNYQLNTNVLSQTAGTLGNDDLIGEHLFILATMYHLANDKIYKSGAKLYNTVITRTLSEGITSFTLSVSYLFGMAKAAMPSGINMDVAMDRVIVVARDGNINYETAYMNIAGLVSSYNEHDIFEKIDGFSSVSTVRALQVASVNGIAIEKINSSNIAQILPTLQMGADITTDIQNAINAGKEVTIPQANVQINDWNGTGYIVKDPLTGSGTYMISGGLAGADSTSVQDGMQCVELFKEPLGWVKDGVDPPTRNTIATVAAMSEGDEVTGPFITQVAASLENAPYNDIDCSQLVRLAYWAAGICLDEDAGVFTNECKNGNNLAARYHVAGGNGVAIFYAIADAQKLYKSVRQDNPLVGDMIFWDNTWDRNGNCAADDKKTHMGIVKSVNIDGKGTIDFMHASSSKGVGKGAMNRTNNISSGAYNTQFRLAWTKCIKCSTCSASSQCGEGSKLNPCTDESAWNSPGQRANQLFTGYGTVRNVK